MATTELVHIIAAASEVITITILVLMYIMVTSYITHTTDGIREVTAQEPGPQSSTSATQMQVFGSQDIGFLTPKCACGLSWTTIGSTIKWVIGCAEG